MCGTGNLQACEVMYAFEMARSEAVGAPRCRVGVAAQRTLLCLTITPYPPARITGISVALQPPRNK